MNADRLARLFARVRDVPDFPKPGILFRDITPLVADPSAFREVIMLLAERIGRHEPTTLAAIEARGFVFGAALAMELGLPLELIRKPGKLPWQTVGVDYALEYGNGRLEMHRDAVTTEARVAIVDDLLATGGTVVAAVQLVQALGAQVSCVAAPIELRSLGARARLDGIAVESLLVYP
ncbi:MAG TPA: adenine phosphoribosyltransferase [Nevskiaceae bacterium]|nr:adenine phosphoribosyltransferase [Nevskiaceae bacterium]